MEVTGYADQTNGKRGWIFRDPSDKRLKYATRHLREDEM